MLYRKLGRTNLKVSEIGLGTEYLKGQPTKTVVSVVHKAIENGINYFDLVFNLSEYINNLSKAFEGFRNKVFIAHHLGSAEKEGKYRKTRNSQECEKIFYNTLSRLKTDYVDILNLHFVKTENEFDTIVRSGGLLELALKLKEEGKVRFIGMSTHDTMAATKAVKTEKIDVIMTQINIANNAMPGRNKLLSLCNKEGVGLVAMKPFAGGKLLQKNRTVYIGQYQTGYKSFKKKISPYITPTQCISYVLAQIGVSTTVPGVKNIEELNSTLAYTNATNIEKDFSRIVKDFKEYKTGECVYCDHCSPCPSDIEIGSIIRIIDMSHHGNTKKLRVEYNSLPVKASDCTECGVCTERCPFDVDIVAKMKEAIEIFGS